MSYKKIKLNHITLKALELGHKYTYPIFYNQQDNIYNILIKKDHSFSEDTKKTIDKLQIKDLYVLIKDYKKYEQDTQQYISKIIYDKNVSAKVKSEIIHDMANDTMKELFSSELNRSKIEKSEELINNSIELILDDKSASKSMLEVTSYDYYTYSHCVNVSVYALAFGVFLNLEKDMLMVLGSAAILHDLGKKNVPNEIVNKDGKLTDEEFEVMKMHPTYAVEILKSLGETNKLLLEIIEQHHEKLDGTGYPKHLKKEDIHFLSQIIAIVDIFDALTTKRSYKNAMKSFDALDIMHKEMSHELNGELLEKFIIFMSDQIQKDNNRN
jgi:putative nucleotidyltransferase with HDIG domain